MKKESIDESIHVYVFMKYKRLVSVIDTTRYREDHERGWLSTPVTISLVF